VAGEESKNRVAECAPWAVSNSMLKEQMEKLHNMELVEDNKSTCDKTDDDKSIA
jgi:hypothetical protein